MDDNTIFTINNIFVVKQKSTNSPTETEDIPCIYNLNHSKLKRLDSDKIIFDKSDKSSTEKTSSENQNDSFSFPITLPAYLLNQISLTQEYNNDVLKSIQRLKTAYAMLQDSNPAKYKIQVLNACANINATVRQILGSLAEIKMSNQSTAQQSEEVMNF